MTEGPPQNYWQYKDRVEAKLAAFRATGLSRFGDGRTEWAEYVAYQAEQHREWLAYERLHYPTLSHDQGQKALADARAAVVAAQAGEGDLPIAVHQLEVINYELWGTDFEETEQRVDAGTEDLSDPLEPLRAAAKDAAFSVHIFQRQVDAGVVSSPPSSVLLAEAKRQLANAQARLDAIEGA